MWQRSRPGCGIPSANPGLISVFYLDTRRRGLEIGADEVTMVEMGVREDQDTRPINAVLETHCSQGKRDCSHAESNFVALRGFNGGQLGR